MWYGTDAKNDVPPDKEVPTSCYNVKEKETHWVEWIWWKKENEIIAK